MPPRILPPRHSKPWLRICESCEEITPVPEESIFGITRLPLSLFLLIDSEHHAEIGDQDQYFRAVSEDDERGGVPLLILGRAGAIRAHVVSSRDHFGGKGVPIDVIRFSSRPMSGTVIGRDPNPSDRPEPDYRPGEQGSIASGD